MKKFFENSMFLVLVTGSSFLIGMQFGHAKAEKNLYPLTTVVSEVNRDADTVTCTDTNGDDWQFYGCEDWQKGDICTLLMEPNATRSIYDDKIIQTRYGGVPEDMREYVNMENCVGYSIGSTNGLYLHFVDGTGYYWE